ncbi:MAG: SAM-dependent methyltransferase [Bacillales bacterium]|jgi:ubiquinone/menaquinone biosynthesis C-methylase UbiE|nr:SAM-dependent methyltransferase [Bacillales bacterium]
MGHRFNPENASKLMNPKRMELIPPNTVTELLELNSSDEVSDLGAGNGYFTIPLAKSTQQTVYAIDIEPKMLDLLKENAIKENITNITYLHGSLEEIPLEDESVDKILIAFVMHEIPNITKAVSELKRIMKSYSKILVLEWDTVQSEMGPPLNHRIGANELKLYFEQCGLQVKVEQVNEQIYGLLMSK